MTAPRRQVHKALALLSSGRFDDAARLSASILNVDPFDFDALHISALSNYHSNKLDLAIRHINRACQIRTPTPEILNTRGLILRALSRYEEAVDSFLQALALNKNYKEAHYNLANSYRLMNDLPSAVKHYDCALQLDRGMAAAWNNRGLALAKSGQYPQALHSFDKAIELRHDFAPAYYNKGDLLASIGDYRAAIHSYDTALHYNQQFSEAYCNRAKAKSALRQYDEAINDYERATQCNPRLLEAQLNKGVILVKLNRLSEALKCFERCINLWPEWPEAHYNFARVLTECNSFEEALESYNRAINLRPNYPHAYNNRSMLLKELKLFNRALEDCDNAIRLKPDYADAYNNRGIVLSECKRFGEALSSYDKSISLDPNRAEVHNNRGNALSELMRLNEAIASYDEAIRLRPEYAEAFDNRGDALAKLKRLDEAIESYDRAISLKPDYPEAYNNRGNALSQLDRFDEAISSYDRAICIRPNYPEALYNKALLLMRKQSFLDGFALYKSRWYAEEFSSKPINTVIPMWDGCSRPRHLLLWAEQGIGDEIFYSSMLSLIDREISVSLFCDRRLHEVYRRSFPNISLLDRAEQYQRLNTDFDAHASIGDLAHLLSVSTERIAERNYPFLVVDAERRHKLVAANTFLGRKPVCGISWKSGNKSFGREKSISLQELSPLLRTLEATFVNLQYGDVTADISAAVDSFATKIHCAEDVNLFSDIDGLLTLIDACDIVLTTSNVTAHLAGAIGKSAAVLVPRGRSRLWYWHDRPQSIWYPSIKLFGQSNACDWSGPICEATDWIKDNISER